MSVDPPPPPPPFRQMSLAPGILAIAILTFAFLFGPKTRSPRNHNYESPGLRIQSLTDTQQERLVATVLICGFALVIALASIPRRS